MTNGDRIRHCISDEFAGRTLKTFCREELQDLLDRKAAAGLSFSVVDHVRWDLMQIFDMAEVSYNGTRHSSCSRRGRAHGLPPLSWRLIR